MNFTTHSSKYWHTHIYVLEVLKVIAVYYRDSIFGSCVFFFQDNLIGV